MMNRLFCILLAGVMISGCVSEDIIEDEVEERITITNAIDSLRVGESHQFIATFWNNVGMLEEADLVWASSDPTIITVDNTGLAMALTAGNVDLTVSINGRFDLSTMTMLNAGSTTSEVEVISERTGSLRTTSSYVLEGDFVLSDTGSGLVLSFEDNFRASSGLPGLYVYLTNNPNTINGAIEIGPVTKFNGPVSYDVPSQVNIEDYGYVLMYCKPFVVKVGDGIFDN